MNKKRIAILIGFILAIVVVGAIVYLFIDKNDNYNDTDALKFKREYEALNGEKAYGENTYQTLEISENNKVEYTDLKGAVDFLEKGNGLIYFGFPNCPWCRGILPTLLNTVESSSLNKILYVDMTNKRDIYEIEDKQVVKTKEASAEYYKILSILDEYLEEYKITDEDDGKIYETGVKRLFVPLVVAVKDGKVKKAVTSPVKLNEGQTAFDPLTDEQKADLRQLFKEMVLKTEDAVCDEHC